MTRLRQAGAERPVVVYFDGACEPMNPGGHIGWAWVALARDGRELAAEAKHVPAAPGNTNNMAEYLALIDALGWLRDEGHLGVLVRGDSQLVIRQMTGEYRVNSPILKFYHQQASVIAATIDVRFEWVRREFNHRADAYSKNILPAEARYGKRAG